MVHKGIIATSITIGAIITVSALSHSAYQYIAAVQGEAYAKGYAAGYAVPVDNTSTDAEALQAAYTKGAQDREKDYQKQNAPKETKNSDIAKHINDQLKTILQDDKQNPVCEYWEDQQGYGHGCLTDIQLNAIIEIDTFINNEI